MRRSPAMSRGAFAAARAQRVRRLRPATSAGDSGPWLKPRARVADVATVPDLLFAEPRLAVDAAELCGALDFAFAGGGCLDQLERALDQSVIPVADGWDPACYASDLFVEDFVDTCMKVTLDGSRPVSLAKPFLLRVLTHPPDDLEVVETRRAVLRELETKEQRQAFANLYRDLRRFRRFFDHMTGVTRYEVTRRRIDTLALFRGVVEQAKGFAEATSALSRIGAFASEVQASDGWQQLIELLDYENDLAKVDVRMQLGADGRVRRMEIVHFDENEQNRFYTTPFGRLIAKFVLFWRGYRFSSEELVDRWLDHVFQGLSHFMPPLMQLLGHMEVHLAALAFKDQCESKGLEVCFPELIDEGDREVVGLFNPLLFKQGVVPKPCELSARDRGLTIITGPNSGGKTRLLQSLGLTQLLGQVGLYAPAVKARLPRATGMFVSLIDEPKAEQKEGRLGTELMRIRRMFETTRTGGLVLLDELCSGTNPSEGEEIFYLVLSLLDELGPESFITTHFLEFARKLSGDDEALPLSFLQVELDDAQRPTYGFSPGVATTSLATQTAARLGVTREELMALVQRNRRR